MNEREPFYNSLLELIFSNRNKRYGAYDLRKQYVKHLRRAFIATLLLFALFMSVPYFLDWWQTADWLQADKETTLIPVKLDEQHRLMPPPPPEKQTPPPKPPPKPQPPKPKQPPAPKADLAPVVTPTETEPKPPIPNLNTPDNQLAKTDTASDIGKKDSTGTKKNPFKESDAAMVEPLDTLPMYPGGMTAMYKYIYSNLRYPPSVLRDSIEGTIVATFIVNVDGSISHVKIDPGFKMRNPCDEEVIRVLRQMPYWKPGRRHGRSVKTMCAVKISFSIE